ncbi:hypothetical protein [Streptomyces anthocyanicus]|uniref:hypothetical protein n=1 Tax=Streptomyces anthocyanicus TaxID=68174 RepID=UPI0038265C5B
MDRAAAAYEAARREAEQHGVAGERATSQAQRAFVLAFTHPEHADDEVELARHLVTGLSLRQTSHTIEMAALARDAGTDRDIEDRARILREQISISGVAGADAGIARLRDLTRGGAYAYYADIAQFMLGRPADQAPAVRWLDDEQRTRDRWRALVTARQAHLRARQ